MKNLKLRRQFILSNLLLQKPENWQYILIHPCYHLYFHPDLQVTQAKLNDVSVTLLGYILDPYNPCFTNDDIIKKLAECNTLEEVFERLEYFSGRFVIVYCNKKTIHILNDATGFRQLYYSFVNRDFYCGSTPNIINKYANLQANHDKQMREFFYSPEYRKSGFWIGTRTPIKNVFHLLPNFYLDLNKQKPIRYWPNKAKVETPLKTGTRTMAEILEGTIKAASERYSLYQALTSGWDSRALLAASRNVKTTKFFVGKSSKLIGGKADVNIPGILAKKFGIDFNVIDISNLSADNEFRQTYFENNVFARETFVRFFYNDHIKMHDHVYWVTGTFSNEILRIAFPLNKRLITPKAIAKKFGYEKYKFAIDSISEWMDEAAETYERYGYDLVNMFYWEQYTGNWENLGASEGDISREEIHPFNCRKLITTYLSLKNKYRYKDYPVGHIMIIKYLWKELLDVPVAPYTDKPSYWVKRLTRFLGIELLVDKIYNYFKNYLLYSHSGRALR